jgi:hypothetical protein
MLGQLPSAEIEASEVPLNSYILFSFFAKRFTKAQMRTDEVRK